jgi:hypothetical protein
MGTIKLYGAARRHHDERMSGYRGSAEAAAGAVGEAGTMHRSSALPIAAALLALLPAAATAARPMNVCLAEATERWRASGSGDLNGSGLPAKEERKALVPDAAGCVPAKIHARTAGGSIDHFAWG